MFTLRDEPVGRIDQHPPSVVLQSAVFYLALGEFDSFQRLDWINEDPA